MLQWHIGNDPHMKTAYVTFGDRLYSIRDGKFFEDTPVFSAAVASASKKSRIFAFIFFSAIGALTLFAAYGDAGRAYGDHIAYWWKNNRSALLFVRTTQQASLTGFLPLSGDMPPETITDTPPTIATSPNAIPALKPATQKALQMPYLSVPKLRIQSPIIETQLDEAIINKNLERGIIRWPTSENMGAGGTTILLGHSSAPRSYRGSYGKIFSLLDKLQTGDTITVATEQGTLQYRVRDHIIIDPNKTNEEILRLPDMRETLILVSCWPVGTNWQRIAVRASRF